MGNRAVREELDRAVVVRQLFGRDAVGVVVMDGAIDADDLLHEARDRADVVRDHHDRHPLAQLAQRLIQLVLEAIIDEVGRLVEDQQLRVGDDRPTEQRALHLTARNGTDRVVGHRCKPHAIEERVRLAAVVARVAMQKAASPLQARQNDLDDRDREGAVEGRQLRHIADQPLAAVEELGRKVDRTRIGHRAEDRLHEGRFTASVRADHPEEVPVRDRQTDVVQSLAAVVGDADAIERDQIHRCVIFWVIRRISAQISSANGSNSTASASISAAMASTLERGNCRW